MIEAWKKLETVLVLDHQWTASCRFADIVLPVTTRFERNDIEQFGTHSNKGLIARHDFDIFAGLCKRFDKEAHHGLRLRGLSGTSGVDGTI